MAAITDVKPPEYWYNRELDIDDRFRADAPHDGSFDYEQGFANISGKTLWEYSEIDSPKLSPFYAAAVRQELTTEIPVTYGTDETHKNLYGLEGCAAFIRVWGESHIKACGDCTAALTYELIAARAIAADNVNVGWDSIHVGKMLETLRAAGDDIPSNLCYDCADRVCGYNCEPAYRFYHACESCDECQELDNGDCLQYATDCVNCDACANNKIVTNNLLAPCLEGESDLLACSCIPSAIDADACNCPPDTSDEAYYAANDCDCGCKTPTFGLGIGNGAGLRWVQAHKRILEYGL